MKKTAIIASILLSIITVSLAQSDNPCSAPQLSVGTSASASWTIGNNNGATTSYVPITYCDGSNELDVWYKFQAPTSGVVNIETDYYPNYSSSTLIDLGMAVYTGNCSTLSSNIDCNAHCVGSASNPPNWMPCLTLSNLTPNATYYIRLWAFDVTVYHFGQFKIRVYNTNTSTSTASISVSPNSLPFGSTQIGTTSTQSVTISNTGSSTLNVYSISKPTGFSSQNTLNVSPGGSQTININFSPSSATSYNGNVSFNSNATQGTVSISVSGTGTSVPQPTISVSPASIDFGSISVSSGAVTNNFTISNTGNASLNISSITVPTGYLLNWTSGTISAQGQKDIQISFDPSTATSYNGFITINSNATNVSGGIAKITLAGAGLATVPNSIMGFVKDLGANPSGNQLVETALSGATVKLKDANNQVLNTTTTNSSGQYTFTGYNGTNYTIEVTYGQYTVTKQGYNASSAALTFVIPNTILYQINQQVAALENLTVVLTEKSPAYNTSIQGFSTSGLQSTISQTNTIQYDNFLKVKNSVGRIFATQQMLMGYYQNANKVADRASYCLYNAASVAFSIFFTIEKVKAFCFGTLNLGPVLGNIVYNLITFIESKAYDFVSSGFDYYISTFPNSSAALAVSEIQSAVEEQMLRIKNNNNVFYYALNPMSIVYDKSAKGMLKYAFKNPSQSELNESYSSSANLNTTYFQSLNNAVSFSKQSPLQDATSMNSGVMSSMNNALIYSDAVSQVNSALGFATAITGVTPGFQVLAGFLGTVKQFLSASQIASCLTCFGMGVGGTADRKKFYEFSNNTIVYFKTDSLGGNTLADLDAAITAYNSYANEVKDHFDYSQDWQGISKLDSLIKLDNVVQLKVRDAMLYIMAAGEQADSSINGYSNSYITQLLQNINRTTVKSMALSTIHLAKCLDTLDASIDPEIVSATQEMVTANNDMRISINQFANLINQFQTPAYPAIQSIDIKKETQLGETQTVRVTIKNYGNQNALGLYLLAKHDSNFTATPDSIYIGKLDADRSITVQYQLTSPNADTVGGFTLDVGSNTSPPFTKGGAVLASSTITGMPQFSSEINLFNVYPVPVSNLITIEKMQATEGSISATLYDLTGKQILFTEIFKNTDSKATIDVSQVASGAYSLVINTLKGKQTFKIIKQ
ncbi:MAG: choice-of-anchor D domain-containing protein [Chitinophagales bacterium]|nr:choice-of-anchor D domain-containing protein [Chitinophagales bacterium]